MNSLRKKQVGALVALFFWVSLLSSPAAASNATLHALAQTTTWLNLLHAEPSDAGQYRARVVTPKFLISSEGRDFDPYVEIQETHRRFLNILEAKSYACRFPARFLFLSRHLSLDTQLLDGCKFFDGLSREDLERAEISAVYAAGYLGNPASYYGHMMFRITADITKKPLFDQAVNYGAVETTDDNPVEYILKGLFGGYEAAFSIAPYYVFANQYSALENRDLWVYDLQMPAKAQTLFLMHLSEMQRYRFDYFFTERNCVSAFADVLSVVDPEVGVGSSKYLVYPHALLRSIANSTAFQAKVSIEPARTTEFRARFSRLSSEQRSYISEIRNGKVSPSTSLENAERHIALNTLGDYALGFTEEAERKSLTKRLALTQLELDFEQETDSPNAGVSPPHKGRYPSTLTWGILSSENSTKRIFRLRPAFYDELDGRGLGYGARALSMMDLTASIDDAGALRLEKISFLRLRDLDLDATGFGNDKTYGWSGELYWEREKSPLCVAGCSGLGGSYGVDGLIYTGSDLSLSTSLKGLAHQANTERGELSSTADLTLRYSPRLPFAVTATVGKNWDLDGTSRSLAVADFLYEISDRSAIRLELRDYWAKSVQLSWQHYF